MGGDGKRKGKRSGGVALDGLSERDRKLIIQMVSQISDSLGNSGLFGKGNKRKGTIDIAARGKREDYCSKCECASCSRVRD